LLFLSGCAEQQSISQQGVLGLGLMVTLLCAVLWMRRMPQELCWQFAAMAGCWLLVSVYWVLCASMLAALPAWQTATWQTAWHGSQFVFLVLQGLLLLSVLRRFGQALAQAENLAQALAASVDASRQQLEIAYGHLHQLERLNVADVERMRIYRDLHDDVGSKLLSIIHGSRASRDKLERRTNSMSGESRENGESRESREGSLAAAALESMRNAVARANNPNVTFKSFLTVLHEEMQLRLQGAGIALIWEQPSENLDWVLNSDQNYQLNRIFRELVNNVLRHAAATVVEFSIAQIDGQWQFSLADNGRGFHTSGDLPIAGMGLRHIRERSLVLAATSQWMSRPQGGVIFTLLLPAP
jgi:signal transduction histidine kinase